MRRPRPSVLTALIFAIALSLVGSTSSALYLQSMGPKECCKSHCPHGQAADENEAARCCTNHLGVLPSALAKAAPDVAHAFAAVGTTTPAVLAACPAAAPLAPARTVMLRGSPPRTLVAAHIALLS